MNYTLNIKGSASMLQSNYGSIGPPHSSSFNYILNGGLKIVDCILILIWCWSVLDLFKVQTKQFEMKLINWCARLVLGSEPLYESSWWPVLSWSKPVWPVPRVHLQMDQQCTVGKFWGSHGHFYYHNSFEFKKKDRLWTMVPAQMCSCRLPGRLSDMTSDWWMITLRLQSGED